MLYQYCERCGPGLFDEPLNLVTNASFYVAAWFLFRLMQRRGSFSPAHLLLLFLVVMIGTGSALFHAFANGWARMLDVIPIVLYQLLFLWLYLRRVAGLGPLIGGVLVSVFLLLSLYAMGFKEVLNGSLMYLPALAFVAMLGVYHYAARKVEPLLGLAALLVFFLSLLFRTIDASVCSFWPFGTHLFWHLLNGLLLYVSSRMIILNDKA